MRHILNAEEALSRAVACVHVLHVHNLVLEVPAVGGLVDQDADVAGAAQGGDEGCSLLIDVDQKSANTTVTGVLVN